MISQRELANRTGLPVSTYNGWEKGRSIPIPDKFRILISFYKEHGIDTAELEKAYTTVRE